ncbi:DUF1799 domain-containing protein [Bordetella flabilis]|uniref:DUF1799 domain-containing protein n=1 Tax=Bordetella flabilis TaxID=463014 RepID=A0A193GMD8_9BORD|nr:DUF1799 domain-containing protein [Bordetella flabilis]ANN80606.1 hypothetical protein BAU07_18885 [Bordetella flabilis]
MRLEDYPRPVVELWPDSELPFSVFARNHTQWRMGFSGPVGLDYAVIYRDLDRLRLTEDEYDEAMDAIRVIERAALEYFHKS